VNDPPTVVNDAITINQNTSADINVLGNDSDAEGPLTVGPGGAIVAVATNPANGTATVNANGSIKYTPSNNFVGTDTFTYQVTDSQGALSSSATVTVTVQRTPSPWQNPNNNLDVNADGFVSPIDVLLIVNYLNLYGNPAPTPPPAPPYLDVNGNFTVEPVDVQPILTRLNAGNGEGAGVADGSGGEGEGADGWEVIASVGGGANTTVLVDHRWSPENAQAGFASTSSGGAAAGASAVVSDESTGVDGVFGELGDGAEGEGAEREGATDVDVWSLDGAEASQWDAALSDLTTDERFDGLAAIVTGGRSAKK
ncbi:MAG TPA: Ig-like domain-containing protein, partial [Pirellulaceae bacterium]|nr:Ig-like domain-containing protein [Pirellulaceae bacterium]